MADTTPWIACYFCSAVSLTLLGCQSTPQAATPAEVRAVILETTQASDIGAKDAPALQQLEQNSGAASDAIKAIDIARGVSLHNLSNAGTVAFKRTRAVLQEGGKVYLQRDFSQGTLEATGRRMDYAIQGEGFFKIRIIRANGDDEVGYTRVGNFFVNATGQLAVGLDNGYELSPPITFPTHATNITISQDGRMLASKAGGTVKTTVGRLALARFMNPEGLEAQTAGIFTATEASGEPRDSMPEEEGSGMVMQGFLESSNVDVTHEIIRLHLLNQWRAALVRALGLDL